MNKQARVHRIMKHNSAIKKEQTNNSCRTQMELKHIFLHERNQNQKYYVVWLNLDDILENIELQESVFYMV